MLGKEKLHRLKGMTTTKMNWHPVVVDVSRLSEISQISSMSGVSLNQLSTTEAGKSNSEVVRHRIREY